MAIAHSQEEEKNKRIAAGVSIGIHALILLFLIYMLAWRAPDPPAEELGIQMNFGTDDMGSGDVQTLATPNESKNVEDSKPAPTQPDPVNEPEPVVKPTPPTPVEAPKVTTTTAEAPVSVKEEVKPQPKPQPKEEVVKKEPEKPKSLYPGAPTNSTGNGKSGTSNNATGNNNGDDAGKVGDKGSPDGDINSKAMYGKAGGGAGGSLDMPGWRYDIEPKRDPYSNETGIIRFQIKIDADGNLVGINTLESNVSPQVKKWYEDQLRKTSFSRTGGSGASAGATGVVTFRITSR
ncbi:hypothetical protein [Pontibacter rugosus]|uniref:Outer membrane transport energization protein TonB n=1 Tax=Pontibacter rugosus TaxID=1745966 RepID=A0ABW3SR05_9BACT